MMSSIRDFWRQLSGAVHPDDQPVFERYQHTFNLEYPPPAFIGDVDHAPVIVLMENGDYDPNLTPTEFARPEDRAEYVAYLHGDRSEFPTSLAPYYTASPLGPWLTAGKVAVVNAVAYRSPKLSQEPRNRRLAEMLPSVAAHRHWLHAEVIPAARAGKRLVIAHRHGMWRLDRREKVPNMLFSTNPVSPHLSSEMMATISEWLNKDTALAT